MSHIPITDPTELRHIPDQPRRLAALARVLGWACAWNGNSRSSLILRADDGKVVVVPVVTSVNAHRMSSMARQILAHSEVESMARFLTGGLDMRTDPDAAEVVARFGPMLSELISTEVARRAQAQPEAAEETAEETPEPEPEPVSHNVTPSVGTSSTERPVASERVVTRRPWVARYGGQRGRLGRMYESLVVEEVTYADGSKSYKCSRCDYTNSNPRSVASHTKAHPKLELQDKRVFVTTQYEPSGIVRGEGRPRHPRLTADILMALDHIGDHTTLSRVDLAERLAEAILENRPEREPAAPLTDAEIIQRIGFLLDRGQFARLNEQVTSLTDSVVALEAEVEQARAHAEEAEARAVRRSQDITALRQLIDEIGVEAS